MDSSPPGSSVHGISQAIKLERVAISFSRGSSQARDWTHVSYLGKRILEPPGKPFSWITWEKSFHLNKYQKFPISKITGLNKTPQMPSSCLILQCDLPLYYKTLCLGKLQRTSNYGTIALISHARKVMLKILQARLHKNMNQELPDVQAGFRKGRGNYLRSNCQHSLDHRESKRIPEKHLLHWLHKSLWLCGSQQTGKS